jgi:fused signal recognition particle receptor
LGLWAERVGADFIRQKEGADPAAVVYDALSAAKSRGADLVLVDTAGRLHNKANLMEELKKIGRVTERELGRKPDEVLLALDATTGQNAIQQAKQFVEAVGVTGLVLAKIGRDRAWRRGHHHRGRTQNPHQAGGRGRKADDLQTFDPDAFVADLLGSAE